MGCGRGGSASSAVECPSVRLEGPVMSKVRVNAFTVSLDAYGAGPEQSLQNPLGKGGETLHDIRIGGGVETIRQYLRARLIDELHLAFAPVLLGAGESLFAGIDVPALGYEVTRHVPTDKAVHVVLSKRA